MWLDSNCVYLVLTITSLGRLKRTNRPLRAFFSRSSSTEPGISPPQRFPRTNGLPSVSSLPFFPPSMYDPQHRRVRGQETDGQGRRLGATGGEYDYDHDDKDLLPAYDTAGGPPKYIDFELASFTGDRRLGTGEGVGAHGGVLESPVPINGAPPSPTIPGAPTTASVQTPTLPLTRLHD